MLRRFCHVAGFLSLLAMPACAFPVSREGAEASPANRVQFNRSFRQQRFPGSDGGGMSVPRGPRGGGFFPGGFRPPLVFDPGYPPRRRPPVIVEDDFDDVPERPRRRIKRPPPRPVAARPPVVRPPANRPPVRQATPRPPRVPPVSIPVAAERRLVADEVLLELRSGAQAAPVLQRHRLTELASTRFELPNALIIRARVEGGRSARQVLQQMAGDARIASAQPNYLYTLQQTAPVEAAAVAPPPAPPTPKPQYAHDKLGLAEAHRLAQGGRVKVALIDTGVDERHPELEGAIAARFDSLGTPATGANAHGTAMAGAIIAKATLRGVSPAAQLISARAFGGAAQAGQGGAEGTSFHILTALDWASGQGARVLNLSFAGPQDRLLSRALEGARARKIIAIAAVGNAGPSTPALYPAADASVLAVTATDAQDQVFPRANTGAQVAIAAPGVDVIAAAPEGGYTFSSGTSIAAAHVSGLVALMLERNPDLDLAAIRQILRQTAQDLGPKGPDPVYGAGRANAAAAVAKATEKAAPKP